MAHLQSLGWYGSAGIRVGDRRTENIVWICYGTA
jgi:hypothetical protein